MVTLCEIRFDNNPKATFQSGQTLQGTVILTLTEKKKFRALYLKIEGSAKCVWTVTKGAGSRRRSVTYAGKDDYLNQTTYLLGSQTGSPIEMLAGVTTYSFACVLPLSLPSSVEGKFGNIRYSCKAVLDRPWKTDKEFRISFSVLKTEDLNLMSPTLMEPVNLKITRHFYCCCFKSKPFHMSAILPFSGFVPGQTIEITLNLNNQSNIDIEGTKVSLERNTQYISQTPRRKIRYECLPVKDVFGAGVKSCGSAEVRLSLVVPPLPPTNEKYCRVLTTGYHLKISAKVSGAHKNPHLSIPITIGTIPFRSSFQAPNYDAIMNSSIASSSSHPTAPPFDMLPPSYEQAISVAPEADLNVSAFAPLYPVWNFSEPSQASAPGVPNSSPFKVPM